MHTMSYRSETLLDIWNSHKECKKGVGDLITERKSVVELCEIKFKPNFLRFIAPIFYESNYLYGKFKYGKPHLTGKKVNVSLGDAFGVSSGVSKDLRECSVEGSKLKNFFRGLLK